MKYIFLSLLFILLSTHSNYSHAEDTQKRKPTPVDDVILLDFGSNETITLGDVVRGFGLDAEHIQIKSLPDSELKDLDHQDKALGLDRGPIIKWHNPQTIKNINPPMNKKDN